MSNLPRIDYDPTAINDFISILVESRSRWCDCVESFFHTMMNREETYRAYADFLGKEVKQLSLDERKSAWLKHVLETTHA